MKLIILVIAISGSGSSLAGAGASNPGTSGHFKPAAEPLEMPEPPAKSFWIEHFVSTPGNHFYCSVPASFLADSFNLIGLPDLPFQKEALALILSGEFREENVNVEASAMTLFGLIHARYITTPRGE